MKNKLLLLLLCLGLCFQINAEDKDGVFYWKNNSKKILNYMIYPDIRINIEKLDIDLEDHWALVTVNSEYKEDYSRIIEELANGYTVKRAEIYSINETSEIEFINTDVKFTIPVIHSPNGIEVSESFVISKKTYNKIINNKNYLMKLGVSATPLLFKKVEVFELPSSFCQNLFNNGNELIEVSKLLQNNLENIGQHPFKYSSTYEDLKNQIPKHCFKETNFKFNSFNEIFNFKLTKKETDVVVRGVTHLNSHSIESVDIVYTGEI